MPEPLAGASGDGYRVRIVEVGTDNYRCSSDFYLMASADAPGVGEMGGPTIGVVEPNGNSVAVAGDAYTVEVRWLTFVAVASICFLSLTPVCVFVLWRPRYGCG